MKIRARLLAVALGFGLTAATPALAAERTIVLDVPSMTCAACPLTVKKALERVPGVTQVKTTYEPKEAVVTYDDSKTTPQALMEATEWAGYPSQVKQRQRAAGKAN
ncbi:MAG: mercury resistance system periplasmic binding protein MerP [Betaproteobacteria bacterium]|nr:mercury resistance system periplasmic binding protein MerP [Betaproteobacteria bacterium]